MEAVIALILGLIALLSYQMSKRRDAEIDSKLAETKGKDSILSEQQDEVKRQLEELDAGIKKMQDERAKAKEKEETPDERAKKWDK